MQNANIEFTVQLNAGPKKGTDVKIYCDLEELEEEDLSSLLIEKGHLEEWCNNNEYTVVNRSIQVFDDKQ